MRVFKTVALLALAGVLGGAGLTAAYGQAGSIGLGWCPICRTDVSLSHDFTHGRNRPRRSPPSGGGGSTPPQQPASAPQLSLNQRRAQADYFYALKLWEQNDGYSAVSRLESAARLDPGSALIRDKLNYIRREHEDMIFSGEPYAIARRLAESGELEKAISDLRYAEARLKHGDTDFARKVRDELKRVLALKEQLDAARRAQAEAGRQESLRQFQRIITESLINFPDSFDGSDLAFDKPFGDVDKSPGATETAATMSFPPLDDAQWLFEKGIVGSPPVDTRVGGPAQLNADPFLDLPVVVADLLRSRLHTPLQKYRRDESGDVRLVPGGTELFAPTRIARDTEILAPLNAAAFQRLDDKAAVQLLVRRHEAAEAEARRWMSEELARRINRLVGNLGDAATDLATLERTNPEFAARLNKEQEAVERESRAQVHQRYATDMQLLALKLTATGKKAGTPTSGFVESVLQSEQVALQAARARAFDEAFAVADAARAQGLFEGVDNVVELERRQASDRRLANAIRQLDRISAAREVQERGIRTKTLETLQATGFVSLEPILGIYKE